MSYLLVFIFSVILTPTVDIPNTELMHPADCKVLLEQIGDSYEGECKKGLAHGQGMATGEDTYTGEFKKGLPHGTGLYRWANGDSFEGEWKKGLKEGSGKLMRADSSVQEGFWIEDEYIGEEKEPYKIIAKSGFIHKITFKRIGSEPNKVDVYFVQNHRDLSGVVVSDFGKDFGKLIPGTINMLLSVNVDAFPFAGFLEFSARSWITKQMVLDNSFDIQISQPGHWKVTVDLVATE